MAVLGVAAVGVPDHDLVAVRAAPARGDHVAGRDRLDGGAGGYEEVDAGVVALRPVRTGGVVGRAHGGVDGGDERVTARGRGVGVVRGVAVMRGRLLLRRLLLLP